MLDYKKVLGATEEYFDENLKEYVGDIPIDIEKAKFNELIVNILNQYVLDTTYTFKESDYDFINKYNLNITDILITFRYLLD